MFTGIIEGTGKIVAKRTVGGGIALDVDASFDLDDPEEGESIAVNGVCLTAYNIKRRRFSADVSPETLSRTKLGTAIPGALVNLERALRLSDRLGGHIVSGHVDCMATVSSKKEVGDYTIFALSLPKDQSRYIIEKGSVAIDGISLTVNSCVDAFFEVSIIPHTMKMTTLLSLKAGDKVNIEVDIIGKYVEKLLSPAGRSGLPVSGSGIDPKFLAENGFL